MNLANGMNQNMQLWDYENPWRATLKSYTNFVFNRNDPEGFSLKEYIGYKSECTKWIP
jgi:hypothetical protein